MKKSWTISHRNKRCGGCGVRSDALRILDAELQTSVDVLLWATDDGTFGFHGNVLQLLQSFAKPGDFGVGHLIGPIPMMKAVANATRAWCMKL
jgi:NAD(P)H-flavin reductase